MKKFKKIIIAIDGPSSSGKGTVAKMLANYFNIPYLNTGALYRKVAFDARELKLDFEKDIEAIINLANNVDISDLEAKNLHNEKVGKLASIIAKDKQIRLSLKNLQRNFANQESGAVLDGRDIGTVICKNADYKFFITASLEERTSRRYLQLSKDDALIKEEDVFENLQERDLRDKNRDNSPFVKADDAIEIDTSNLSANEAFKKILEYIK